jgi:hypothetical protein
LKELRRAYFVAGDVGTAAFHTALGDDMAAWLGPTAFDPRWVSAEIAGARSAVDTYMGRMPVGEDARRAFLFTSVKRGAGGPAVIVVPRARGLLLSVDRRAVWSATPRILVTQALAQWYLGAFLSVGRKDDPASGAFFSAGYTRALAREILFEGSEIDQTERAAELNALLAATVFSDDARELATARGSLSATALDVAMRKTSHGERGLRELVRGLLDRAQSTGETFVPIPDLVARVREAAGDARARDFEGELTGARPIPLPVDLLAPCYRLESKVLVPFELGFVTTSDAELRVVSVKPGSHAATAGLEVGDVVSDLHYADGRASVPVTMTVKRGDTVKKLRFFPGGTGKPGRVFERVPGIPNERC